jgi:hypothetical protein
MARGFNVSVRSNADGEINEGSLAAELEATGQLTELEHDGFLPAALKAAKDLSAALKYGPFVVEFSGSDRTQEGGEESYLTVTVTSRYTQAVEVAVEPEQSPEEVANDTAGSPQAPEDAPSELTVDEGTVVKGLDERADADQRARDTFDDETPNGETFTEV